MKLPSFSFMGCGGMSFTSSISGRGKILGFMSSTLKSKAASLADKALSALFAGNALFDKALLISVALSGKTPLAPFKAPPFVRAFKAAAGSAFRLHRLKHLHH